MKAPFKSPLAQPFLVPLSADVIGTGQAAALPLVPVVKASSITTQQDNGILVRWDRPMSATCDIADHINVVIDGAAPVHPQQVIFDPVDPKKMGIILPTPFIEGQTVTWSFDDQGPCQLLEVAAPHTKADNQTYAVSNQAQAKAKMITVWRTQADGETLTLPTTDRVMDFFIDWGDHTPVEHVITTKGNAPAPVHTYTKAGDYNVKIHGNVGAWYQNNKGDKDKLIQVKQLGKCNWNSLSAAFYGCKQLERFVAGSTDTSKVTVFSAFLSDCTNLGSIDVSTLDTSSNTRFIYMFQSCTKLKSIDVSTFNTTKGIRFKNMFRATPCTEIIGLKDFDITNADNLSALLNSTRLSSTAYGEILESWSKQKVQSGVGFGALGLKYECGPAEDARRILTDNYGWVITDDGPVTAPCQVVAEDTLLGAAVGSAQEMKLQVKGKGTAESKHAEMIFQPDADGVYVPFAADAPVWRGGRREERVVGLFDDHTYVDFAGRFIPPHIMDFSFSITIVPLVSEITNNQYPSIIHAIGHVVPNYLFTLRFNSAGNSYEALFGIDGDKYIGVRTTDAIIEGKPTIIHVSKNSATKTIAISIDGNRVERKYSNEPAFQQRTAPTLKLGHVLGVTPDYYLYDFIFNGVQIPLNEGVGKDIHDSDGNVVGTLTAPDVTKFWSGRVKDAAGRTFADDDTGKMLVPTPVMHYQEAVENKWRLSTNLLRWKSSTSHPTITLKKTSGLRNDIAYELEDSNKAAIQSVSTSVNIQSTKLCIVCYIKKDNVESRFPEIYSIATSGSGKNLGLYVQINTKTGISGIRVQDGATDRVQVVDCGQFWKVVLERYLIDHTLMTIHLRPAGGKILGQYTNQAVGKCIFAQIGLYEDKTIEEVKDLGPIFTYRSPASTPRIDYQYDVTNINNEAGAIFMEVEPAPGLIAGTFLSYGLGGECLADPQFTQTSKWSKEANVVQANNQITFTDTLGAKGIAQGTNHLIDHYTTDDPIFVMYRIASITKGQHTLRTPIDKRAKSYHTPGIFVFSGKVIAESAKIMGTSAVNSFVVDWFSVRRLGTTSDFGLMDMDLNYVSLPGSPGQMNTVGLRWDKTAALMSIMVNGKWSADVPYSGRLAEDFKLFTEVQRPAAIRNIRAWRGGEYAELKKLLDEARSSGFSKGFSDGFK